MAWVGAGPDAGAGTFLLPRSQCTEALLLLGAVAVEDAEEEEGVGSTVLGPPTGPAAWVRAAGTGRGRWSTWGREMELVEDPTLLEDSEPRGGRDEKITKRPTERIKKGVCNPHCKLESVLNLPS